MKQKHRMTFNFANAENSHKLVVLAKLYQVDKTKVICDLIDREYDSLMGILAVKPTRKERGSIE